MSTDPDLSSQKRKRVQDVLAVPTQPCLHLSRSTVRIRTTSNVVSDVLYRIPTCGSSSRASSPGWPDRNNIVEVSVPREGAIPLPDKVNAPFAEFLLRALCEFSPVVRNISLDTTLIQLVKGLAKARLISECERKGCWPSDPNDTGLQPYRPNLRAKPLSCLLSYNLGTKRSFFRLRLAPRTSYNAMGAFIGRPTGPGKIWSIRVESMLQLFNLSLQSDPFVGTRFLVSRGVSAAPTQLVHQSAIFWANSSLSAGPSLAVNR